MKRPETLRQNRWQVPPEMPANLKQKFSETNPILLQILYNRGLTHPALVQSFLSGRYIEKTDPFLLPDMEAAVSRIEKAIENEETIIVYGDFDADGVTSTVLLTQALRGLGISRQNAQPYIPNRVDEGYGLNMEAIEKLKEKGADLIISVDCGIRSVEEVAYANELGIDMIITDHHSVGAKLPEATAVINPKRECDYPEKMLAGVGIAYKLAQALRLAMPDTATYTDDDLVDLVAIGTVADLAPLLGENRKLVINGLAQLNKKRRVGLIELAKHARINDQITAESIGFGIGPRINAAGRLAHAYTAARLLSTDDPLMAQSLAADLNHLNQKRQQLTADLCLHAESLIDPTAPIIIAADEQFVSGVVGLVASRLTDKLYRPAIILEKGVEESRASCRSIPEFHITDALDKLSHLLVRHGGHAQAAGFTIRNEHLAEFIEEITTLAREQLDELELFPTLAIDVEIELEEINWAMFEELKRLEPTGYANPAPVFVSRNVEIVRHRCVGQDGSHLQLTLASSEPTGPYQQQFPAIAFQQGDWDGHLPQFIDVVYSVSVNEYRGNKSLQLIVQDIKPASLTRGGK